MTDAELIRHLFTKLAVSRARPPLIQSIDNITIGDLCMYASLLRFLLLAFVLREQFWELLAESDDARIALRDVIDLEAQAGFPRELRVMWPSEPV
jgi:hypothetical protein